MKKVQPILTALLLIGTRFELTEESPPANFSQGFSEPDFLKRTTSTKPVYTEFFGLLKKLTHHNTPHNSVQSHAASVAACYQVSKEGARLSLNRIIRVARCT